MLIPFAQEAHMPFDKLTSELKVDFLIQAAQQVTDVAQLLSRLGWMRKDVAPVLMQTSVDCPAWDAPTWLLDAFNSELLELSRSQGDSEVPVSSEGSHGLFTPGGGLASPFPPSGEAQFDVALDAARAQEGLLRNLEAAAHSAEPCRDAQPDRGSQHSFPHNLSVAPAVYDPTFEPERFCPQGDAPGAIVEIFLDPHQTGAGTQEAGYYSAEVIRHRICQTSEGFFVQHLLLFTDGDRDWFELDDLDWRLVRATPAMEPLPSPSLEKAATPLPSQESQGSRNHMKDCASALVTHLRAGSSNNAGVLDPPLSQPQFDEEEECPWPNAIPTQDFAQQVESQARHPSSPLIPQPPLDSPLTPPCCR
jgi:hypothetical protein